MGKKHKKKSSRKQPEDEPKFSQQQYEMLLRCSAKKDMTEWNEWRKEHPKEEICLHGVYLMKSHLENAILMGAHLENADLSFAHLENAELLEAHLENAELSGAHLENAFPEKVHFEKANLAYAHLENAELLRAHLENAKLDHANLENAHLTEAHLENAILWEANLRGTRFWNVKLQGADFSRAIVDGGTLFSEYCEVDRNTKFEAVALGNLRIYPNIKQLLEYNVRRKNWEQWYKDNPRMKWLVKPFWLMSDYGSSTGRIAFTFFILAFFFAAIYYICGILNPPGIVSSLFEVKEGMVPAWLVPLRTIYFSIVTMTTLGFGDMHANYQSFFGHLLLTVQVILGYVLLGALVTRFAVLFTAGGPAGKFAPSRIKETAEDKKNKE
jgi:hypothetical protein